MIVFIFTIFGWQGLSRVIRSQVLVLKNTNYIKAAELAGASKARIMFKHILPGVAHLLIMSTAMTSAGIMVAEAGLSFLYGAVPPYVQPVIKPSTGAVHAAPAFLL